MKTSQEQMSWGNLKCTTPQRRRKNQLMVEPNTNIALDYFKAVLHVLSHIGSLVG